MKKLLTVFLCLVMAAVFLPTVTFAGTNYFEVTKDGKTQLYATSVDAVASVADGETATIKLLADYNGGGVQIKGTGKDITFDLNGFTWTIGSPLVGSAGTETNAFQLLKDNKVTFRNGEITSNIAKILFQNYADLTIDGVDISLTTPGTGMYAASNNNGSTVIKGGSTITVSEGNFAMDSFTFGNYDGGNVIVQDAAITGDVEIANGGRLKVDGGTIDGDVTVYNYAYDDNAQKASRFTMEKGMITGNLETSKKGVTAVNGGMVAGKVTLDTVEGAKTDISGGIFGQLDGNVTVAGDADATFEVPGDYMRVVGAQNINAMLEALEEYFPEEAGKVKVTVTDAKEGVKFTVPEGVTIVNGTDSEIIVNDKTVAADEEVKVEPPATEPPQDTDKDDDETEVKVPENDVPKTGDEADMLPWLAIMALTAAGATVLKKREN